MDASLASVTKGRAAELMEEPVQDKCVLVFV